MANVSTHSRSRKTHRTVTRRTHQHSGYLPALTGAEEVYQQIGIDASYGEQNIMPGSIQPSRFPTNARPVVVLGALPTLPDPGYPVGSTVVLLPGGTVYRNVAEVWTAAVGAISGGIEPVGTLPTLPDANYPNGAVVFLTTDDKLYRNDDGTWSKAVDGADIMADTITANAIAAGAITASELAANSVTAEKLFVQDAGGSTVLTGAGFGGSWVDYLSYRIYNGSFGSGTLNNITAVTEVGGADTTAEYLASLSADLPYWVVDAESGAGTLQRVADSAASGGYALRWDGAEDATVYQDIPITPGHHYSFFFNRRVTVTAGQFSNSLGFSWRDADHAIIGTEVVLSSEALIGTESTYSLSLHDYNTADVAPPAAVYCRVTFRGWQVAGTTTFWLDYIGVIESIPGTLFMENGRIHIVGASSGEKSFKILQSGDTAERFRVLSNGDIGFGGGSSAVDLSLLRKNRALLQIDGIGGEGAVLRFSVTSGFPTAPAGGYSVGDLAHRRDHLTLYQRTQIGETLYWVSTTRESSTFAIQDVHIPFTVNSVMRTIAPPTEAYWETVEIAIYVATTNDASNYWTATGTAYKVATGTNLGSANTSGGTNDQWLLLTISPSFYLTSGYGSVDLALTKTGSPGSAYVVAKLNYRRITT